MEMIHLHHFSPKPLAQRTSRIKGHEIESKARARSSLKKIARAFDAEPESSFALA
jgi:hypothetical protein